MGQIIVLVLFYRALVISPSSLFVYLQINPSGLTSFDFILFSIVHKNWLILKMPRHENAKLYFRSKKSRNKLKNPETWKCRKRNLLILNNNYFTKIWLSTNWYTVLWAMSWPVCCIFWPAFGCCTLLILLKAQLFKCFLNFFARYYS